MSCVSHSWLPCGNEFLRCARCGHAALRSALPCSVVTSGKGISPDRSAPWPGTLDPLSNSATTARDIREAAKRHFKDQQFAEALPVLKLAIESFPEEEQLWKELVWSAWKTGQLQSTAEFAKQGIRHHPKSSWLWGQLGRALTGIDRLDEAEIAINKGLGFDAKAEWLWRHLAVIHRKQNDQAKEIGVLEKLREFGLANSQDLNELGTAYFKSEQFIRALDCYRLSAAAGQDYSPYFNLGLVYNRPEIAQKTRRRGCLSSCAGSRTGQSPCEDQSRRRQK